MCCEICTSKLQESLLRTHCPNPSTYCATSLLTLKSLYLGTSFIVEMNIATKSSWRLEIHLSDSCKSRPSSCMTIVTRLWPSSPRACLSIKVSFICLSSRWFQNALYIVWTQVIPNNDHINTRCGQSLDMPVLKDIIRKIHSYFKDDKRWFGADCISPNIEVIADPTNVGFRSILSLLDDRVHIQLESGYEAVLAALTRSQPCIWPEPTKTHQTQKLDSRSPLTGVQLRLRSTLH